MNVSDRSLHWDCRETAKAYVNTASVLAGFAFTAVILVLTTTITVHKYNAFLKDWTSIAFLIGFFGCIISTFIFSIIAGEGKITSRAYTLMLLGGSGLVISGAYLFWGIILLMELLANHSVILVAHWIFFCTATLSVVYLMLAAVDIIYVFGDPKTNKRKMNSLDWTKLTFSSLSPIILSFLTKFISLPQFPIYTFNVIIFYSLLVLSSGGGFAIWKSNSKESFRFSVNSSSIWIFFHSVILSLLILILPKFKFL